MSDALPMDEPFELLRLARALEPHLLDDARVHAAMTWWQEPMWRVVVIGRQGVGKTTLVNLLARTDLPTGLGGVTEAAQQVQVLGTVLVDTPPMSPKTDLTSADAVVWVVDGLQPVTHSERTLIGELLPPGVPLFIVVSRLDLVPIEEQAAVLQRVVSLCARWLPQVHGASLRKHPPDLQGLVQPAWPSPRRRQALGIAVAAAAAALDTAPAPPDPQAQAQELVTGWRALVRSVRESVEHEIAAGRIDHRLGAGRRLRHLATEAVADFASTLNAPPPALPLPDPEARGELDLQGGLGGAGAAVRHVQRRAAQWAMAGELTLLEWADAHTLDGGCWRDRQRAVQALARAGALLS